MRLRIVGSSPAWPNPGGAQSGYLLDASDNGDGGGRLLLDCGPGVLGRLREDSPTGYVRVDAIAITHFHLDHWGDLVPWAWLRAYGPDRTQPKPVLWLPPSGHDELATFASFWGLPDMFESAFEIREFPVDAPVEIAGFMLEAKKVEHYGMQAYGFRIAQKGKTLAYSGDSAPTQELADLARGADLFLVEATLSSGDKDGTPRGHLSVDEALAAADGPVLLTHRPYELPSPDGIDVAFDGLVVDI
jgi:ribonuclease BN (tRNA processing enzyme)